MASSVLLSDNGASSGSAGIKSTGGNDGVLLLQTTTSGGTATTAVTIDTSQNVGIGVTPSAWGGGKKVLQASNASFAGQSDRFEIWANAYYDGSAVKYISNGYATLYQSVNGAHNWQTAASGTAGGTVTLTQAMTLDASGNLLVGTTSTVSNARFVVVGSVADDCARIINQNASPYGLIINYSGATPNNSSNQFIDGYDNNYGNLRFKMQSNGGLGNYQANNTNLSDRREKTNFAPAGDYLAKICAIPVQTFNYIDQNLEEDDGLTLGVVAQDVQAVAPELVMESNWAGKDAEPKMRLSIYQTDLQYALMKSIQELKAIVDAQAAEIAALKGAQA